MTPQGIDHLVIAVKDLDRGRETFARLGLTISPPAHHPFGTANAVIQFPNGYVELLAVADRSQIVETTPADFSLAAFTRDFLSVAEGLSMMARRSGDADADLRHFAAHGLPHVNRLDFERQATGLDGVGRKVAFSLAVTQEPRLVGAGFFTCQHHNPGNFWQKELQTHAIGASAIDSLVLVVPDPADFHEFLTYFSGQHDMYSSSLGVSFDLGDSRLEVMTPVAFKGFFGEDVGDRLNRFAACRLAVNDLAATRRYLDDAEIPYVRILGNLVIPSSETHGVTLGFVQARVEKDA
jgi:hypothetical protein